jgi:hypothetical protein
MTEEEDDIAGRALLSRARQPPCDRCLRPTSPCRVRCLRSLLGAPGNMQDPFVLARSALNIDPFAEQLLMAQIVDTVAKPPKRRPPHLHHRF